MMRAYEWPGQSPDANALDYAVWHALKVRVQGPFGTPIHLLRDKIKTEWAALMASEGQVAAGRRRGRGARKQGRVDGGGEEGERSVYAQRVVSKFRARIQRIIDNDGERI